jgi:hypothetical protein
MPVGAPCPRPPAPLSGILQHGNAQGAVQCAWGFAAWREMQNLHLMLSIVQRQFAAGGQRNAGPTRQMSRASRLVMSTGSGAQQRHGRASQHLQVNHTCHHHISARPHKAVHTHDGLCSEGGGLLVVVLTMLVPPMMIGVESLPVGRHACAARR